MSYSGFQSQYPAMTPNPTGYQSGQAVVGQQAANPWSQIMGGYGGGYNPTPAYNNNPIMGYSNPTSLMSNNQAMGYGGSYAPYTGYGNQSGYGGFYPQMPDISSLYASNPGLQQQQDYYRSQGGYSPGPIGGNTPSPYSAPSTWQQNLEEDLTEKQRTEWENIQKKAKKAGFYDVALPPKMEQYGAGYNTPGGYNPRGGWSGMEDVAATQTWGPGPELTNPMELTSRQQKQWESIQKNLANRGFDVGATLKQRESNQPAIDTSTGGAFVDPRWGQGFAQSQSPRGRYGGGVPDWLRRRSTRENPVGPTATTG